MASSPRVCGFLFHSLRFSQEYRYTAKIVCDGCFCTVQTNGFGFGYFTCDHCGFKACARCASLIPDQSNDNVGQVQESSSGPTALHASSSWIQQQPSSNPLSPFTSSATTNHPPGSQQRSNPPNPFAFSAAANQSAARQQSSNLPNPFASSVAAKNSQPPQQRSNPPNPFASSAATNHLQPQQQRSNLSNPAASSAATNHSQSHEQLGNLLSLFATLATTKISQRQQQRSNPPNPFAVATNYSQSQQQRTTTQVSHGSLQQKETVNATQSSPSSPWENLYQVNDSDIDDRQYNFQLPSSFVDAAQKKTVNAAQPSSSSPWGTLHEVNDSDDHEQQKRAVNVAQSCPLAWDLDDVDSSDEEEDDEKQPVIPCAGSFDHELQFLERPPYNQYGGFGFGCNMCYKTGFKDLYHCEICQFDGHKACAEIQEEVKVFFHKHPLQRGHMDDEEFTCRFCVGDTEPDIRPWVYTCLTCPNFTVHARCAKYAKSLKHVSHPHKLKLVQNPVIGDSPEVSCDGCCNSILEGYHYTCAEQSCDFDLHPSCAILPSAPLCRLDRTHRVKLDYHLLASCYFCSSQDEARWMYRCTVCDVCMHTDCFNSELSDSDELSDSEELSDGDEEDEDFGELYQKFQESIEDFGSQGNEEQVEKLSELVDSFKSNTKAKSSLARQRSVKSSLYSTRAQNEVHILDDGFAKMSLGDSSRSEVRNRDAEEEERRRAEQIAKEQKAERRREKAERRREKAATRALQEKENVAWREKVASDMQNFANKLQNIQHHQQAGSSNVATAKQVAELQASMENWKTSDAKRHQEQSKLLQDRHQEQTKLLQERHNEYMSRLHEIIRTQVHSQTRAVPRLVLCSETIRNSRKLLTVLRVGLKGVRLDLLCEHADQPHVVSGAPGCEINQKVAGDRWTSLQPFLAAGVMIVTSAVNFAGMGALSSVLPNLQEKVWDIHAVDLGEHAMPTGRNKLVRKPEPADEESAADWLQFYLRDQNINIAETFKLHRVRYKSPDHVKGTVGWLCSYHLAKGKKDHVLHRFP